MTMFRSAFRAVLLLATVSAPSIAAAQGLIYNNGLPNGSSGNEMTAFIQAEDFTLGQSYNVTGIRFWGFELANLAYSGPIYSGSIAWRIYENDVNVPDEDNILFSGIANLTPINEGPSALSGSDRLRFDIATNFTLAAGSYWLGLHNGDYSVNERRGFFWESTAPNSTALGREDRFDDGGFDNGVWNSSQREHAFQLFGQPNANVVPEPSTSVLIALGFAGLVVARRRRTL